MLYHQEHGTWQGMLLYYWADSSPQGNRDWLLTRFDSVRRADVVEVFRARLHLLQSREVLLQKTQPYLVEMEQFNQDALLSLVDDQEILEILTMRAACTDRLGEWLAEHVQPPMGVGSKAASLEVKLRGMLFGAWLERGSSEMPMWASQK